MRWFNSFRDGCYRHAFRLAYPLVDQWWQRHPRDSIALALWVDDRVLSVLHSYKPGLRLPGGACKRDEPPPATVLREAGEEVGITLDATMLRYVLTTQGAHGPRHLFEAELATEPTLHIDQREIVYASFIQPTSVAEGSRVIRDYLARHLRPEVALYRQPAFDW